MAVVAGFFRRRVIAYRTKYAISVAQILNKSVER